MFAEVFHEMLTLEFASSVYRGILREVEAMEAARAVERKRKREAGGEEEGEGEEGAAAAKKVKQEGGDAAPAPAQAAAAEGNEQAKAKSPEPLKTEKKVRTDTKLLLAFRFFDRTGCGYVRTEDLGKIFGSLGMPLTHRMIKDLVASAVEVAVARSPAARTGDDRLYIREITDKEIVVAPIPSSAAVPQVGGDGGVGEVAGGGGGGGGGLGGQEEQPKESTTDHVEEAKGQVEPPLEGEGEGKGDDKEESAVEAGEQGQVKVEEAEANVA